MKVEAWDLPIYRPPGQTTEATLQYAKEAIQKREATNSKIKNCAGPVFSDFSVVNEASPLRMRKRGSFSTEEQIAEKLSMHLILTTRVTKECVEAFREVAHGCYKINLSWAWIGYDSFDEFLKSQKRTDYDLYASIYGEKGFALFSDLIAKYSDKPFSALGILNFLSQYVHAFAWLEKPARTFRGDAQEKAKILDAEYRSSLEHGLIDSEEIRWNFLKNWFEKNETFLNNLKNIRTMPSSSTQHPVIAMKQLEELIEIAGQTPYCKEFELPHIDKETPDYTHLKNLLEKWNFKFERYCFEKQ
jgi:hypothetical protein